jgi:hypothetical protein
VATLLGPVGQAKDTLITMSRKLEVAALQIAIEDGTIFFVYLSRGLVTRCCFFFTL